MEGVVELVTILTDDIEPMRAFYSDALGFEVIEDLGNYVEFRNPGVRFAICTREVMYEATGHESYREEMGSHAFELPSQWVTRMTWTGSTMRWWLGV